MWADTGTYTRLGLGCIFLSHVFIKYKMYNYIGKGILVKEKNVITRKVISGPTITVGPILLLFYSVRGEMGGWAGFFSQIVVRV